MKKYRPSNGTEGMWFEDKFCDNCINQNPNPDLKPFCEILCNALCYDLSDKEYPSEWTYDVNGKPTCTSFKKWDWGNDGDPNDPENPKYVAPDSPNQLVMPFLLEEIGIKENIEELIN